MPLQVIVCVHLPINVSVNNPGKVIPPDTQDQYISTFCPILIAGVFVTAEESTLLPILAIFTVTHCQASVKLLASKTTLSCGNGILPVPPTPQEVFARFNTFCHTQALPTR